MICARIMGLVTATCSAIAAPVAPDQMVREFFGFYSTGKAEKAFDELYSRSEWMDRGLDVVRNLKRQPLSLIGLLGEFRGR